MDRTLVIIKPEAIQRGLAGTILARLELRGLKLVALKMLRMDEHLAQRLYAIHQGKAFFHGLIGYITRSPVIAAVLEGKKAVEVVRRTMGETDPVQATPGTIRGDLALEIGRNLIHGSDSPETAASEVDLFFAPEEIISYQRDGERWITESSPPG